MRRITSSGPSAASAIAVVGYSCRLPGAPDPDAFWELLENSRSAVSEAPENRWERSEPISDDIRTGGFLDAVDLFDADFFGISPREAAAMDPQQRLLLELGWEAVEHAGIPPAVLAGTRTGVFVGAALDDYAALTARRGPAGIGRHSLTGTLRSLIANRLSHVLGLRGPSMTVDTGQSSSLVAVHLACESLRGGESGIALAGGVNLNVLADSTLRVARFGALSPDGRCHTFDARANGYVRGEGGGLVLLKPLETALADGDRVRCVILGSAVGHDGAGEGLVVPNGEAQQDVVRAACEAAGVSPADLQYVELHGTGTRVGDRVEATALGTAVGAARAPAAPLLVGSAKTNVGHLEGAAGIVGLLKTALSVEHRALPASLNFERPHPDVPLADLNLSVVRTPRPWPAPEGRLLAGVSSFGLGGTNCHVIVASPESATATDGAPVPEPAPAPVPEPAPAPAPAPAPETTPVPRPRSALDAGSDAGPAIAPDTASDAAPDAAQDPAPGPRAPRPLLWLVSGRGQAALRGQARRLLEFAAARPELDAAAVGRTLATRRTAFSHRAAVLAADAGELRTGLAALRDGVPAAHVTTGVETPGRVALVFPGQGAQWPGMATELLATEPVFAARLAECADALAPHVDWSPMDLLRAGDRPDPALWERVDVIQPLLFAVMVALAALWRSAGVRPDAVAGHSQGEIAAACVAGALSLEDAALLVTRRSRAVSALSGRGGMLAVAQSHEEVAGRLRGDGRLDIAVVNGPGACVVSGARDALDELHEALREAGVEARRVAVDYASHSRQVEEIREPLLAALAGVRPARGTVPLYSTVTGTALDPTELTSEYWYRNLRHTVRFDLAVQALLAAGHHAFIEVSPHPVLLAGLRDTLGGTGRRAFAVGTLRRGDGGPARFLGSLAEAHNHGVTVDWDAVLAPAGPVDLPTYAFQRERHWLDGPQPADEPFVPGPAAPAAREPAPGAVPVAELRRRVPELVTGHAAAVLGRSPASLPLDRPLRALGFDSLGLTELFRRLGQDLGLRLPTAIGYDHPTVEALVRYLGSLLDDTPEDPGVTLLDRLDAVSAELTSGELDETVRRQALARLRTLVRRCDEERAPADDLTAAILAATPEEILGLIDSRGES
ncbi:acyltransferase domain-containing protein [Streptomyces sp. NPDC042638]|uniref:type I polyketide synthase n=1 Tax=Streptomyces sp. NPDC042638 TaxID=3154333 RepID=UPI0033CD954D